MQRPLGPLAGLRWPASKLPAGALVHDDGSRLWIVPLHGRPYVIWRHPRVPTYEIAAGPGGHELALSLSFENENPHKISSILYLLRPDGSIQTVDATYGFWSIETPTFIRAPTDPRGPVRLVWIRFDAGAMNPATDAIRSGVYMSVDGRPSPVAIALRDTEAPLGLASYPGTDTFSMSLFRVNNAPTRYEILENSDISGAGRKHKGLLRWSAFDSVANTDVPPDDGPAWIRPGEFVTPIGHLDDRTQRWYYTLRVSDWACGYNGTHDAYTGQKVDPAQQISWRIQPIDANHVLVLLRADVARVADHRARTAPWYELDVWTGKLVRTQAMWSPIGWWTVTQPARPPTPPTNANCDNFSTYP